MPFKSEKQRRFLWAEHPEIAKKWADKYPDSNKNLPMYASDTDTKAESKEKAAQIDISAFIGRLVSDVNSASPSILNTEPGQNLKKADSKQEKVDMPRSEKPVYAGEEREKGMISSSIDTGKNVDESQGGNAINTLLQKLSVVLAPEIAQTMENLEAEREGRVPVRVGKNRGLKQYPVATPQIPLPMGMSQAQAPAQPQQTAQTKQTQPSSPTPVGAGQSTATTDPIKFHSGLSMSGVINGNASLSAPNTVNTKISAAKVDPRKKKKPAQPNYAAAFGGATIGLLLSKALRAGYRNYEQGDYDDTAYPVQDFQPDYDRLNMHFKSSSSGDSVLSQLMGMDYCSETEMLDLLETETDDTYMKAAIEKWAAKPVDLNSVKPEQIPPLFDDMSEQTPIKYNLPTYTYNPKLHAALQQWENTMFDGQNPTALPKNLAGPLSKYMRQLQLTPRDGSAPVPMLPKGQDPDALDAIETLLELDHAQPQQKTASSPAWQRAAGKNDEGGLNAKGRASYNKATGGNLKAPVTEKNPTGERDKRQNSFCSRMCGMKRVNTGAKTKKDPDSRINKALRKWNCKCGAVEKWAGDGLSMAPIYGALLGAAGGAVGNALQGHTGNDVGRLLNYAAGTDYDAIHPGTFPSASLNNLGRNMAEGAILGGGAGVGYDVLRNVLTPADAAKNKKTRPVKGTTTSAAENFGKAAAKRVLNLSPSWGGQKWQLGEWGLNPQAGYRYLGGVVPTPDIALRLGGPFGGTAVGLAPFPYIETDWGRPSGRQANKETRSLYKWIGDGMRDRPTAAAHALASVPEDATPDDYEAAMRSSGVGYSSKELKRLADRMAKMGPLQLPVE